MEMSIVLTLDSMIISHMCIDDDENGGCITERREYIFNAYLAGPLK